MATTILRQTPSSATWELPHSNGGEKMSVINNVIAKCEEIERLNNRINELKVESPLSSLDLEADLDVR